MVADSITDSELFHGSPISRDFVKKRKGNWFWKLKQWKIDARRRQWIYQWKRATLGTEENGSRLRSLRKTSSERFSYRIDHEQGSYRFTKSDDDDDLEDTFSASSPTSVLKRKDDSLSNKSGEDDCFCCSKQVKEDEEDDFDDAFDDWDGFSDALNSFENDEKKKKGSAIRLEKEEDLKQNTSTSQRRRKSSPAKHIHKEDNKSKPEKAAIQKNRRKKNKSDDQKKQDCESCPICSEEMDATDLSFLPCPCGFQLCLFCHKQINETDGRCPGCRGKYQTRNNNGEVSFQLRGRGTIHLSPSSGGLDRA